MGRRDYTERATGQERLGIFREMLLIDFATGRATISAAAASNRKTIILPSDFFAGRAFLGLTAVIEYCSFAQLL